jgi:hypothetical protein
MKFTTINKKEFNKFYKELDPYVFDYILLCNKICGVSHYNIKKYKNESYE